jgi:hypothetical protein
MAKETGFLRGGVIASARKTTKAAAPRGRVNVLENAVIVTLHMSGLGNHRRLDSGKVNSDADKRMLRVAKKLLEAPEYQAINQHRHAFRWGIFARLALPSPLSGDATFVMPLAILPRLEQAFAAFEARDKELVEELVEVWDLRVAESKALLKGEARDEDYPPKEAVRAAFSVRMAYLALGTPDSLRGISAAVHQREVEKFYQGLDETAKQIDAFLTESLADFVTWAATRLSDKEDGKKKGFGVRFEEKLAKFAEFLDTFKLRNLTGNSQLETLVERAKGLLRGVDAEAVQATDFRERVRKGFGEIKATLDGLVETKPTRRVLLEE